MIKNKEKKENKWRGWKIYQKIINNTKRQNYCAIIEVHKRIELEINCFFYINSGIEYSLKVMFYFLMLFRLYFSFWFQWNLMAPSSHSLNHSYIFRYVKNKKKKKESKNSLILCYFQFQALTFILNFYSFGKHWKGTIFACKLLLVPVWNLIYCFFRWHTMREEEEAPYNIENERVFLYVCLNECFLGAELVENLKEF